MNAAKRLIASILVYVITSTGAYAWTQLRVDTDPLLRMPGTQPGLTSLESPNRCLNCHAGYNPEVEPGFNWKGSMMAHAARDFLFYSCMTVAAQDSIWAVGTPNAVDICERCHFPKGWLEGRSDPPNASAMTGADFDGVQCDLCHRQWDPFFEATHAGTRESDDWLDYWDETNASATPSQPAADGTYLEDSAQSLDILLFKGTPFFSNNLPPSNYLENAAGQFFVSSGNQKRASFADADARHQMLYSRYHKSKYFCATCHDVSNPVLANLGADPTQPLPTELNSAHSYSHVERTFSEFMLSAYGQQGGAATTPEFQEQGAPGITRAAKCQDCHMRDVVGVAANKNGVLLRPNESVEHPESGQPLHDLTGGNAWVSWVLASAVPGSPNYEQYNDQQLNQGAQALTLDLSQGQGIDPAALLAGVDRAKQQLGLAATIKNLTYDAASGALTFQVQNNSGHKLISGFPEGRRMFVNIKAYAGGKLIYQVNPYDTAAGTLKGLNYPYLGQGLPDPAPLGVNEVHVDELVYEMQPSSTDLTGEDHTFHFALATGRYKDNRIPPKGFRIAEAGGRLSEPVWHGVTAPNLYTAAEYDGGYDDVSLNIAAGADAVEVGLYYQTTSREYIEFLRDEINGSGNLTLTGAGAGGDAPYLVQSDPFLAGLKAWGDTIWNLWTHNRNVDGAKPFLMASASIGEPQAECSITEVPVLQTATPGNGEVALTWDPVAEPGVTGYNLYYDQDGKAQLVTATTPDVTEYLDTGLTNDQEYCYKVTAYKVVSEETSCESAFSIDILCATPQTQGQTADPAGVSTIETGIWTGKGNNKQFNVTTLFTPGDTVTIHTLVEGLNGPISNATVEVTIGGPEAVVLNSNPSGTDGWAEANWQTQSPNKKGQGGTATGSYTASVTNVTATGYDWDGVTTSTAFTLQP